LLTDALSVSPFARIDSATGIPSDGTTRGRADHEWGFPHAATTRTESGSATRRGAHAKRGMLRGRGIRIGVSSVRSDWHLAEAPVAEGSRRARTPALLRPSDDPVGVEPAPTPATREETGSLAATTWLEPESWTTDVVPGSRSTRPRSHPRRGESRHLRSTSLRATRLLPRMAAPLGWRRTSGLYVRSLTLSPRECPCQDPARETSRPSPPTSQPRATPIAALRTRPPTPRQRPHASAGPGNGSG
jgi:hypothetical protein